MYLLAQLYLVATWIVFVIIVWEALTFELVPWQWGGFVKTYTLKKKLFIAQGIYCHTDTFAIYWKIAPFVLLLVISNMGIAAFLALKRSLVAKTSKYTLPLVTLNGIFLVLSSGFYFTIIEGFYLAYMFVIYFMAFTFYPILIAIKWHERLHIPQNVATVFDFVIFAGFILSSLPLAFLFLAESGAICVN